MLDTNDILLLWEQSSSHAAVLSEFLASTGSDDTYSHSPSLAQSLGQCPSDRSPACLPSLQAPQTVTTSSSSPRNIDSFCRQLPSQDRSVLPACILREPEGILSRGAPMWKFVWVVVMRCFSQRPWHSSAKFSLDFSHVLFHGDQAKDWTYTYVEGLGRIKAQHCISRWCWMYKPGSTEWDSQ